MIKTFNNEFRDMAAQANYPFTADSTLNVGDFVVPQNCFLDALIYAVKPHVLPYQVTKLDGLYGNANSLGIVVADANSTQVGIFTLDPNTDSAMLYDADNRVIGVITYDSAVLPTMKSLVGMRRMDVPAGAMVFNAGGSFNAGAEGTLYIRTAADIFTNVVNIVAANGIHFEVEPEPVGYSSSSSASWSTSSSSESGSMSSNSSSSMSSESPQQPVGDLIISVNMYGELPGMDMPIKSINGLVMEHCWIAAHPSAALRVVQNSGAGILIGKSKDFGNAK
jgi:hypothetical protein